MFIAALKKVATGLCFEPVRSNWYYHILLFSYNTKLSSLKSLRSESGLFISGFSMAGNFLNGRASISFLRSVFQGVTTTRTTRTTTAITPNTSTPPSHKHHHHHHDHHRRQQQLLNLGWCGCVNMHRQLLTAYYCTFNVLTPTGHVMHQQV